MDAGRHPNIELLAYSEVESVSGEKGKFRIKVRKKARYVDEDKCTGCGECAEKCPTAAPDEFNLGLGRTKAIYRYFAQGIPSVYTIDARHCRQFLDGKKCGVCEKICKAKAVDYEQTDKTIEIGAAAIIAAAGYEMFDAARIPEYGYGRIPDVINAMAMERLLSAGGPTQGRLMRPSDLALMRKLEELQKLYKKQTGTLRKFEKKFSLSSDEFHPRRKSDEFQGDEYDDWAKAIEACTASKEQIEILNKKTENMTTAKKLAFVQCVGSRDFRFNRHCSSFCCMHSIKEAVIAKEHDPEVEVCFFGMDIRAVGKDFEEYRNRAAREADIRYIRSRVAEITRDNNSGPMVWYEDTNSRQVHGEAFDLVILATACEPAQGVRSLAETLGIELDEFGFIKTRPDQPQDASREGIFTCGCSTGPMDIPEAVAQASSAAARAARAVISGKGKAN